MEGPLNRKSVTLAMAIAAVALVLLVGMASLATSPDLGARFAWDEGWVVTQADPGSAFRPGDRLLRIGTLPVGPYTLLQDNVAVAERGELFDWISHRAALYDQLQRPTVSILTQRGELQVAPAPTGLRFLAGPPLMHLFVGLGFFVAGAIAFARPGREEQTGPFLRMSTAMAVVYLTNATSLLCRTVLEPNVMTAMNLLNYSAFLLAPACLLHFALVVPERRRLPAWFLPLLYGGCAVLIATVAIVEIQAATALLFLASLGVVAQGWFAYREPLQRQQMKWIVAAFAFGLGPWVLLNGLPLLFLGRRLLDDTITGACLIFLPLLLAVAVRRHRLFEIDRLLEGVFVYAVTVAAMVCVEVVGLGFLSTRLGQGEAVLGSLLLATAVWVLLRERLWTGLRRFFRRAPLDPEAVLRRFTERASGRPPEGVTEALHETLHEVLGPDPLTRAPMQTHGVVRLWEDADAPPGALVAVAVGPDEALLLGPPARPGGYSDEVMRLLEALARQAEVLRENALLFREVLRREADRLAERERLLSDLHDGVGSALTSIAMMTEGAPAALARDALFEIRHFVLSAGAEGHDWTTLSADLREYGRAFLEPHGLEFRLEATEDGPTLSRGLALQTFRLFKEALANALKHAQAKRVTATLAAVDGEIRLEVQDDGRGLPAEPRPGRGLRGMERRCRELGGRFRVRREAGTTVEFALPEGA